MQIIVATLEYGSELPELPIFLDKFRNPNFWELLDFKTTLQKSKNQKAQPKINRETLDCRPTQTVEVS